MDDRAKANSARRKLWRSDYLANMDFLTATNLNTQRVGPHIHHGYTISIVEKGVLPLDFRDTQVFLKPGEFVLLGPEVPHSFAYSSMMEECSYRTVFIKEHCLTEELRNVVREEQSTISRIVNKNLWHDYLGVQESIEKGSMSDVDSIINMSQFLLKDMPESALSRAEIKSPYVKTLREYILQNYTSVPDIHELSEIANISPFYLMRLFKEETGLSPHAYINQLRIHKAKEMIESGEPLLQISYELGFTDQSHFSKTFLKVTGVNPLKYIESSNTGIKGS